MSLNVSAYSIRNPLVAILLFVLLTLGGIYGFMQMKVQQFPDIDLQKSIMIGDMNSDVEFGKNAGMKTIFVGDNELTLTPDDRFNTLYDFAKTL